MSLSEFGLLMMAVMVSMFAIAMLWHEFQPVARDLLRKQRPLMQTGDSSLSPNSVNWLAAAALAGAVLICFGFA
jgi:hypothetical protein